MKEKDHILLSSPNSNKLNIFQSEIDNKKIKSDRINKMVIMKDPKDSNINNVESTSNDTNIITRDLIISKISSQLNYNYDYKADIKNYLKNRKNKDKDKDKDKEEIITKNPIITHVSLTKYPPRPNTNKKSNNKALKEFKMAKNSINLVRKSYKKNSRMSDYINNNRKINSNRINYNRIKLKYNSNNNLELMKATREKSYKKYGEENSKNSINKNILSHMSNSKTNVKDFYQGEDISYEDKKDINYFSEKFDKIERENYNIKTQNKLLNEEIKKLNKYIREQDNKIKKYNNSKNDKYKDEMKDNIIEEMKNKISILQKEIFDLKNNVMIDNKANDDNNNEKILKEIKNLKKLLSEKNNIIETLKNNDNTSNTNNNISNINSNISNANNEDFDELKELNIQLQLEINELKNKLKIKDNELLKVKDEIKNLYGNLNDMKKRYDNLLQKYNEQKNKMENYLKNNFKENNNKENINKNANNNAGMNKYKKLYNNNNNCNNCSNCNNCNKCMNCGDNLNLSCDNNSVSCCSNNNNNTFYKYGEQNKNIIKKIINEDINDDDLNDITIKNLSRNKNKSGIFTQNRLNINYNQQQIPLKKNNIKNMTSNNFYIKNKSIFEMDDLSSSEYDTNLLITSFSDYKLQKLPEINFSEKSLSHYPIIYTLVGAKIIGFNLSKKKFMLINPIDNTNNIFSSNVQILRKYNIFSVTLNNNLGFFMLINNYIFFYSPMSNTLNILTKLSKNHWNGGFISIANNLYVISGVDTAECEMFSFVQKSIYNLPLVNYKRTNSGICNVNNEFIYALFGRNSDNSIERLNIKYGAQNEQKWELIKIKDINENILNLNNLQQFLSFYNDDHIIMFGGDCHTKNDCNSSVWTFSISDNSLKQIGFVNIKCLYLNQVTFIDDEFFAAYDLNNGLHFFNKDLEKHVIFNFQV